MKRGDMYFALDCQMVGVGPEGLDSALARVSIVNWDGKIVLDTYVQVSEPVTDYRTFETGITEEHINSDRAMPIEEVQNLVSILLTGKILIGHALENDLKALCLSHPWTDIRDTAKYVPFMTKIDQPSVLNLRDFPQFRPRKLNELVSEKLGIEIQTAGMAAMALYKSVRSEWEQYIANIVTKSYEVEPNLRPLYADPSYFYSLTQNSDNGCDSRTVASHNHYHGYHNHHDRSTPFNDTSVSNVLFQDNSVTRHQLIRPYFRNVYDQKNSNNTPFVPFAQQGFPTFSPSDQRDVTDFHSDFARSTWQW